MIRNEAEYREAVSRLTGERQRISRQREELEGMGLSGDEVKRVLDPLLAFHLQLQEEVESYEKLKRGEICELKNLGSMGTFLTALRIARGMTQRELAERLGVHETQVSRDERNEYHGITVERAARVLKALGVTLNIRFDLPEDDVLVSHPPLETAP